MSDVKYFDYEPNAWPYDQSDFETYEWWSLQNLTYYNPFYCIRKSTNNYCAK